LPGTVNAVDETVLNYYWMQHGSRGTVLRGAVERALVRATMVPTPGPTNTPNAEGGPEIPTQLVVMISLLTLFCLCGFYQLCFSSK
jgi:hypothetical protein